MLLSIVVLPVAAGAFVVAGVLIAIATLLPKRGKRRVKKSADVKIVFMESATATVHEPEAITNDNRVVEVPSATAAASESEPKMDRVAEVPTVPAFTRPIEPVAAVEGVEPLPQVDSGQESANVSESASQPRRGLGSFLKFGMSRKREMITDSQPPIIVEPEDTEQRALEEEPPRRKLFSRTARVVRHVDAAAGPVDAKDSARAGDVVAAVDTAAGTTTVDARGVIHEQPAEAEFPVERFAENDRVQDVVYASDRERMEAEHRIEMERLAAEREAFDAEHRRTQEAKESKHRRGMEILVARARLRAETLQTEAQARATVQAHITKWWVRLDPDLQNPPEGERIRLAGSLEALRAPWVAKLLCLALEQDESERVRARLLGAYARGYRTEPAPFEAAVSRSQIERFAVLEALTPFAEEASWIADVLARAGAAPDAESADATALTDGPGTEAAVTGEAAGSSVIQLPAPATPPAMSLDAVVAAAS